MGFLNFEYAVYYIIMSCSIFLEVVSLGILYRVPRTNLRGVSRRKIRSVPRENLRGNPRVIPRGIYRGLACEWFQFTIRISRGIP